MAPSPQFKYRAAPRFTPTKHEVVQVAQEIVVTMTDEIINLASDDHHARIKDSIHNTYLADA
jgi:hypothetical protein